MLSIFDFPPATSPRGRRAATQVPSQSLALLNSPIVLDAARSLSSRLAELDESSRIEELFQRLYARPASEHERQQVQTFLTAFADQIANAKAAKPENIDNVTWNRLCHTLLVSNEFLVIP